MIKKVADCSYDVNVKKRIYRSDVDTIVNIAEQCGMFQAIKAAHWLLGGSIKEARTFVVEAMAQALGESRVANESEQ